MVAWEARTRAEDAPKLPPMREEILEVRMREKDWGLSGCQTGFEFYLESAIDLFLPVILNQIYKQYWNI